MVWCYYDNNNKRIQVNSSAELKKLVVTGIIRPDTVIESETGKQLTASKIRTLTFNGADLFSELSNSRIDLTQPVHDFFASSSNSDTYAVNDEVISKPNPQNISTTSHNPLPKHYFTRNKSTEGITVKFKTLNTFCKFVRYLSIFAIIVGIVLLVTGLLTMMSNYPQFALVPSGLGTAYGGLMTLLSMEIVLLFLSIEENIRYQTSILDDIIDSEF
ncbi:MAG: hypothetical protein LBJ00_17790 [Planctomycetaceae bacterium]|jgi:hypothetical protein|nr:hypothetical protein [Planctomycetaceae bacterium]